MKILVVEDSGFVQMYIEKVFTLYLPEAELHFASNGEEGLASYNTVKPDILLTDLLMPKMSGLDLIKIVRNTDPHVKIITISADIQKHVRDELDNLNIFAFINKPLNDEKSRHLIGIIKGDSNA